jgi:hypothetical protein
MSRNMFWRELKELHDKISGQTAGTTHELKRQYFKVSFVNPVMMTCPTSSNVPMVEESACGST